MKPTMPGTLPPCQARDPGVSARAFVPGLIDSQLSARCDVATAAKHGIMDVVSPIDGAAEARSYVKRRPVLFAVAIFLPWVLIVRPTVPAAILMLMWLVVALIGERLIRPPVGEYWPLIIACAGAVLIVGWRAIS